MKTHSIIFSLLCLLLVSCNGSKKDIENRNETPKTYPDYAFCTLPYNIAPCNFYIENADRYTLEVKQKGKIVFKKSGKNIVAFPIKKWKKWLTTSMGDTLWIKIEARQNNRWISYSEFPLYIDSSAISPYLTYRLIEPSYQLCNELVIQERCLESFKTRDLFNNILNQGACVNCHTSSWGNPNYSVYHVRFDRSGTYIALGGKLKRVNLTSNLFSQGGVYPAWHPSNRYIAFGTAKAFPFVHSKDIVRRTEVFDSLGDIMVYDILQNRIISDNRLCGPEKEETFPAFSPDGKTLYFCQSLTPKADSANQDPVDYSKKIKYSLVSIEFDSKTGRFGKMDTLVDAGIINKTVSFPRVSKNGRFVVFCLSNHGTFPIRHPESDLYILDLKTRVFGVLEGVNSNKSESYHEFDPKSNWLMFSSKRGDGMYSRPYFCLINKEGKASKPFLLPQKNPHFYLTFLKSYNVPVFSTAKAPYNIKETTKACENEIVYPEKIDIQ